MILLEIPTFSGGEKQEQEWQLLKNMVFSFTQQPKDAETLPTCSLAGHQGIQGLDTSFVGIQVLHQQEEEEDENRTRRGRS